MSTSNDMELVEATESQSKATRTRKSGAEPKSPKEKDKNSGVKKLDAETSKLLSSLSNKANKKDYGQKIRDSEILHLGLTLITNEHIEVLQQKSIRGKDRQTIAYEKYCKEHGKILVDDYLNKVFSGEIRL